MKTDIRKSKSERDSRSKHRTRAREGKGARAGEWRYSMTLRISRAGTLSGLGLGPSEFAT